MDTNDFSAPITLGNGVTMPHIGFGLFHVEAADAERVKVTRLLQAIASSIPPRRMATREVSGRP